MIIRAVRRVMRALETWPRWLVIVASMALIAVVGTLDFITGTELNLAVLYVVAIVPATWIVGMRWTVPIGIAAGAAMFMANYLSGVQYATPLIPLWNFGSRFAMVMIVARVVVYLHETAVKAESLARTDALTGIGNVRALREAAEREISRAQRYGNPFTVAFIDVDDFKRINDTFGHEAGDRTLRAIGQALESHVRTTDVVARIGGDEFVLLLPMLAAEHAGSFLGALRNRLHEQLEHAPARLTCSIGAVTFESPPASVDEMLKLADARMYAAKAAGNDTIRHSVIPPARVPGAPALSGYVVKRATGVARSSAASHGT